MNAVYLHTSGSGDDGDEWYVIGIYRTRELAERAKFDHDHATNEKGETINCRSNDIEEWEFDDWKLTG
jgi:hypothetical protein